jgi:integrase
VKPESELYPYRRHLRTCHSFGPGGREARSDKCNCPFHVDGLHAGRRVRQSLRTKSRQRAERRLAELIQRLDAAADTQIPTRNRESMVSPGKTLAEAVDRFLESHGEIDSQGKYRGDSDQSTWRKYKGILIRLVSFCQVRNIRPLVDVQVEPLEDFRRTRKIRLTTWQTERQILITFFNYCEHHGWISANPAKRLKAPRNLKPNEVVPYTLQEESQILAACDLIGGGKYHQSGANYEQRRARGMIMIHRHTALRISDVATFPKDAVSWDQDNKTWRIRVRTQKSGEPVYLPIPKTLKLLLDALPLPRNAAKDCPYYFWSGHSSRRSVASIAGQTLRTVFEKSGVKNAHSHRFRHTLATRLLAQGATFEEIADILGNSPAVVRKHYGKWSKGRQNNIDRLMLAHFETMPDIIPVTKKSHEEMGAVN